MNNVSLIGNISTDIDLRVTPSGKYVAKFNVAVNNPFNREKTSFIPVEVWNRSAENTSNFCSKGSQVGIVGHIEIDQYEKDGQKRTFTKVVASSVAFLERVKRPDGEKSLKQENSSQTQKKPSNDPFADVGEELDSDGLPF